MKNKIKIALFAMFTVTLGISALGTNSVFGWHDFNQKTWATSNNAFLCKENLTTITHELVSPCSKAQEAATTWNNVQGSDWTLTYTNGNSAPIHLMGTQASKNVYVGESVPYIDTKTKKIVYADVKFDLDYSFTDVSKRNSNVNYYDFESIALHEFGHLQWLSHSRFNSDSIMQDNLAPNTIRDTPEKHDIDVLKARYPSE